MDLRLAIPALCAWVTAAIVTGLPHVPLAVIFAAWALSVTAIATRRRTFVAVGVCLAAVALVCSVVGIRTAERHPPVLIEAASASRYVTATLTTTETVVPGAEQFAGTATLVRVGAREYAVAVPVLVFSLADERIDIGSTLIVAGSLEATDPADDVSFLLFGSGTPEVASPPAPLLRWSGSLRTRFADAAAALPGDGGDLLPGLAIGDTSAVAGDLDAAMKASSLSHLTAVSGANCAVVVGIAMLAGRALGIRRRWRIGGSVAALVAFVILVTPEPSVLRASVMALLVLAAALTGRTVRGVPILAVAVLGLIVYDPWLARNYGFVLSVLATGALIVLAEPLARLLSRWMPPALALVVAVPLSAQLACQPVLILLSPTIPLFGVVANLLAEPAAPVATVVGLAACAAAPLFPAAGMVLAWVAWVPAAWVAAIARFVAALPGNGLPWLGGPGGLALLGVLSAAIVIAVLASGRTRLVAGSLVMLLVVGTAAATVGSRVTEQLSRPDDWQLAGCDVGQGDAFLVRSAGRVALIDTGPEPALLTTCLDTVGIARIDLLVLTHFDLDHVGGAPAILGMVDRALVGPVGDPADQRLLDDLVANGAVVEQVGRGVVGALGDLRWNVLWPTAPLRGVVPGNDASITMAFTCALMDRTTGCLSSLFLGDLGEDAQRRVAAAGRLPRVDVVKVAHHGSADQNPRIYEAAHAVVGAIGVGAENDFGHPNASLLATLSATGTTALRTDRDGLILLSPGAEPGTVEVWKQRGG